MLCNADSPKVHSRAWSCGMKGLLAGLLMLLGTSLDAAEDWRDDSDVPKTRDEVLRLQIYLDQRQFGPGKLDGQLGEFTYKAVVNCNYAAGRRDLYAWKPVRQAAAKVVPVVYAAFKLRPEHLKFVDPQLPEKPEAQAAVPYLAYRSLLEFVAERYHTDEDFLAACNPGRDLARLKPGDVVVVPNVAPFRIEDLPPHRGYAADPKLSARTVVIDTTERMAAVYDAEERLLAAFPITPGKPEFIPVGTWTVKTLVATPTFRYDKQFLEAGTRGQQAVMLPPGPNSPVGVLWCGLSKSGIGLHGTAFPRTIGRSRSAGCVRLANWDVVRLPQLVRPGATVVVR